MVTKSKEKRAPRKGARKRKPKAPNGVDHANGAEVANGAVPFEIVGPEHRDGHLYLSKADLTTVRLAQYALDQARRDTEIVTLRGHKIASDFESAKRAHAAATSANETDRATAGRGLAKANSEYTRLLHVLGEAYGVDFSRVSFEPTTGRLYLGDEAVAID